MMDVQNKKYYIEVQNKKTLKSKREQSGKKW